MSDHFMVKIAGSFCNKLDVTLQQEAVNLKAIKQEKIDWGMVTNTILHDVTSRSTWLKGL